MGTEVTAEVIDLERELVPLLPLRDVVVFPHTVMPLFIHFFIVNVANIMNFTANIGTGHIQLYFSTRHHTTELLC
jgi:ATP-dependent Lon protease